MMLQNDMGNTKIQDSTTGNVMGLRDGFIPLGMKEHGGILYIASYNLNTKEGELGTIPSPVFNYIYSDSAKEINSFANLPMSGNSFSGTTLIYGKEKYKLYIENPYHICEERLMIGDKFLFSLNIREINESTTRTVWYNTQKKPEQEQTINFPLISQLRHLVKPSGTNNVLDYSGYGWFNLKLFSKTQLSSNTYDLEMVTQNAGTYWGKDLELHSSPYWFTTADLNTQVDVELTQSNFCYITYPNIEPGYLYVAIEPTLPTDFNILNDCIIHITFENNVTVSDFNVNDENVII